MFDLLASIHEDVGKEGIGMEGWEGNGQRADEGTGVHV